MQNPITGSLLAGFLTLNLAGCGEVASLPENAGVGPRPTLPLSHPTLIPTVHIALAKGWPPGATPVAATGFVDANGDALGRPVGVTVDRAGALLVADDVGNVIWRVTPVASRQ